MNIQMNEPHGIDISDNTYLHIYYLFTYLLIFYTSRYVHLKT
jgi:hypothetical protein